MIQLETELQRMKPRLASVAPAWMDLDAVIANVVWAVSQDENLSRCSTRSIVEAVLEAVAMGLDPSGLSGDGTLIPRKTKTDGLRATFVPDYRALLRLMLARDRISHIEARIVREGDKFELRFGDPDGRVLEHRPAITQSGEPIGAYAIAWFKDSPRPLVEWMTRAEIEANAERGGGYGADNSPWETDWGEMARKTVIKRLAKYLIPQASEQKETLRDEPKGREVSPPPEQEEDLARQYMESIQTAAPDGIDYVIKAIREDDRLDHEEKSHLFNLACRRKKELARKE